MTTPPPGAHDESARAAGYARRSVDASMTLLNRLLYWPTEPEYRQATQQRLAGQRRRMPLVVVVLAVLLGALTVWAVLALRAPMPEVAKARQTLIDQVTAGTAANDQLRSDNEQLDAQIQDLEAHAPALPPAREEQLADLAVATGTAPVAGPGVQVTLDDAQEYKDNPTTADPRLRVRDTDLQVVVNGLWAAGAEAMSVNGVRVGYDTAVRAAGSTILADVTPLSPPYTISAIGDPAQLETGLVRGLSGRRLALLRDNYSIPVKIARSGHLEMTGNAVPSLQYANQDTPS